MLTKELMANVKRKATGLRYGVQIWVPGDRKAELGEAGVYAQFVRVHLLQY